MLNTRNTAIAGTTIETAAGAAVSAANSSGVVAHRVLRKQVGQIGHRQQQRRCVRQPDGRQGERERAQTDVPRQDDHHRGEQHRGRVEREKNRAQRGDQHDEEPKDPGATAAPTRRLLRQGGEQPGFGRQLGHDGHGDHEQENRPDPVPQHSHVCERKQPGHHRYDSEHEQHGAGDGSSHPGPLESLVRL